MGLYPEVGLAPGGLTHLLTDRTSGVLGGPPGGWAVLVSSRSLTEGGLGDQASWPERSILGQWQGNTSHTLRAHWRGSHSGTPQTSHLGDEVAEEWGRHPLSSPPSWVATKLIAAGHPWGTRAARAGPSDGAALGGHTHRTHPERHTQGPRMPGGLVLLQPQGQFSCEGQATFGGTEAPASGTQVPNWSRHPW